MNWKQELFRWVAVPQVGPQLDQCQPSEKGALSNLASFYASLTMTNVFKWLFL